MACITAVVQEGNLITVPKIMKQTKNTLDILGEGLSLSLSLSVDAFRRLVIMYIYKIYICDLFIFYFYFIFWGSLFVILFCLLHKIFWCFQHNELSLSDCIILDTDLNYIYPYLIFKLAQNLM